MWWFKKDTVEISQLDSKIKHLEAEFKRLETEHSAQLIAVYDFIDELIRPLKRNLKKETKDLNTSSATPPRNGGIIR